MRIATNIKIVFDATEQLWRPRTVHIETCEFWIQKITLQKYK